MMLPAFTKKSELGISCESREHHGSAEAVLFDRKSTRLNSSHGYISFPVSCLKKKGLDQIVLMQLPRAGPDLKRLRRTWQNRSSAPSDALSQRNIRPRLAVQLTPRILALHCRL